MHKYTQFISQFLICKMQSIVLIHTTQFILHQLMKTLPPWSTVCTTIDSMSCVFFHLHLKCQSSRDLSRKWSNHEGKAFTNEIRTAIFKETRDGWAVVVNDSNPQHSGRSQQSSRLAWCTDRVPGESRLHRESLSQGKKRKEMRGMSVSHVEINITEAR